MKLKFIYLLYAYNIRFGYLIETLVKTRVNIKIMIWREFVLKYSPGQVM